MEDVHKEPHEVHLRDLNVSKSKHFYFSNLAITHFFSVGLNVVLPTNKQGTISFLILVDIVYAMKFLAIVYRLIINMWFVHFLKK